MYAQWEPWNPDPALPAFSNFLGQGVSTMDFNLDGWDDVTVTNVTGEIRFYAGGPEGLNEIDLGIPPAIGRPIALMWLDLDQDGDRDFVHTSAMGLSVSSGASLVSRSRIWMNQEGVMVDRTSEWGWDVLEGRACKGLAFSDMEGDGDLDVMVSVYALPCDDLWTDENVLFRQDPGLGFVDVSLESGLDDGFQPTFQGVWMSLDDNPEPDLFVIHDAGVEVDDCSPSNAAFVNNGDGTFTESSVALGLDLVMSSMTATVGDPDADGEEEIFITNEAAPNERENHHQGAACLDRNGLGVFEERASEWGLDLLLWSWGAMWVDQDLDGWDDLLVATHLFNVPGDGQDVAEYPNVFYRNPGTGWDQDLPFEEVQEEWEGKNSPLFSLGRCDLDADGRPDVVGVGIGPYAEVWRNTSGEDVPGSHGLTVQVCGTVSNTEAIGTRLVLHTGSHRQQRTLRAGEDLYSQHSATQFFGLDTLTVADSLEVFWPTGQRSCWYGLTADSLYRFVEGQEDFAVNVEAIPGTDSVWIHLSPPPKWTGVWLNGLEVDTTTFAVIAGSPAAFEVQWFGGLFSLEGQVDWTESDDPPAGCTIPVADNFDPEAEVDDGSCTYASFCGVGTHWSQEMQQCVPDFQCSEDINGNGAVDVADLLLLLNAFGSGCAEESEDD
jgi:hypothetical protein